MNASIEKAVSKGDSLNDDQRRPGVLLNAFDWAAAPVWRLVRREPVLLRRLFELSRSRMHVIALILAQDEDLRPELVSGLFYAPLTDVLRRALGQVPTGLRRAIANMPDKVLTPESYTMLVSLLADPEARSILQHETRIDDSTIKVLFEIPSGLRRAVKNAFEPCLDRAEGFAASLDFLVAKGFAESRPALIADLSGLRQASQLVARLKTWVESLPLPEAMPAGLIGQACRLDAPAEIRRIGRAWKNCLRTYADNVDEGTAALYLWDASKPAAIVVRRHGRFGWFVEDAKGPENADLSRALADEIKTAFEQAGLYGTNSIEALERLLAYEPVLEPRRRRAGLNGHEDLEFDDGVDD